MPVVTPIAVPAPAEAAAGGPATTAPADGFAAALDRARPAAALPPRSRASIGLAEMLSVRAEVTATAPLAPLGAPAGAAGTLPATVGTSAAGDGAAVIAAGERYLGVPYRWGGTDPVTGFDCSGFVQRVFADLGVDLPRVSVDQARQGTAVASLAAAQPGDLVFWHGDGSRPNHIGIYAGDGQMLVAPRTGDVVRYQEITRTPDAIRRVA